MLIVALLASQPVYAYDIQVTTNSFDFEVLLKSDETTARPTLQMLSEDKNTLVYMSEGTSTLDNEDYTYILSFDNFAVPRSLPTGRYIIRVGGKGLETKETVIGFVNSLDKSNALNELSVSDDKCAVIINRSAGLGIDPAPLKALDDEWKAVVAKAVSSVDFTNDASQKQIDEKYELFSRIYGNSIEKAILAGSTEPADVYNAIEKSSYLGLDKSVYEKLNDKTEVANILANKTCSIDITDKEIIKEFDGAVMLAAIKQLDWGSAKDAVMKYSEKGVVSIGFEAFNKLTPTNRSNVFKDLKNSGLADYSSLPHEFNKLVSRYTISSTAAGGSNGGGGGGGGGSVGGSIVSAPAPSASPQEVASQSGNIVDLPDSAELSSEFTDMGGFAWADTAVNTLKKKGVVDGDGTGRFNPERPVTREEFTKIIVLAFELLRTSAISDFVDVPEDAWFAPYVASAKDCGVISGISDSEFGSGTAITRQDMAVMLKRIYDMAGIVKKDGRIVDFKDFDSAADYARDAIISLNMAGVLNGDDDGNFNPTENVTRAQSAKAVYELLTVIKGE